MRRLIELSASYLLRDELMKKFVSSHLFSQNNMRIVKLKFVYSFLQTNFMHVESTHYDRLDKAFLNVGSTKCIIVP